MFILTTVFLRVGLRPERVTSSIQKLQAAYKAISKPQTRMGSFLAVKPAAKKQKVDKEKLPKKKGKR